MRNKPHPDFPLLFNGEWGLQLTHGQKEAPIGQSQSESDAKPEPSKPTSSQLSTLKLAELGKKRS